MEYAGGTSWLQQQHLTDVHNSRTTTNDEWKEPTAGVSGAGPSGAQPGMDLGDFGLDLSGEQTVCRRRCTMLTVDRLVQHRQHLRHQAFRRRRSHFTPSRLTPTRATSCRAPLARTSARYHMALRNGQHPRRQRSSHCRAIRLSMGPQAHRRRPCSNSHSSSNNTLQRLHHRLLNR